MSAPARLETFEELAEFIRAGDPKMDTREFWDQLGVNVEGLTHFMQFMSDQMRARPAALQNDVAFLLMVMEFGARLALRLTFEDLTQGRKT